MERANLKVAIYQKMHKISKWGGSDPSAQCVCFIYDILGFAKHHKIFQRRIL